MSAPLWRRRPRIDWPVVALAAILNIVLLAVIALPVAAVVRGLLELGHRFDARVPALHHGAVWTLVYAVGLVRAFMQLEITFQPRR